MTVERRSGVGLDSDPGLPAGPSDQISGEAERELALLAGPRRWPRRVHGLAPQTGVPQLVGIQIGPFRHDGTDAEPLKGR